MEENEESDGAESDDDYGGEGGLGAYQYTTVCKVKNYADACTGKATPVKVRKNTCKMMSADKLTSNGVNSSTVGTEGNKKRVSLLDSGATHDIVKDAELLSKIWTSSEVLDIETNGGDYTVNQKGILPVVGVVWYSPRSIINVLSLSRMNGHKDFEVDYNGRSAEPHFILHNLPTGVKTKFMEVGLFTSMKWSLTALT